MPDSTTYLINRGYTFHQHYDKLGLINMNGRVYDPIVGRFLSVDPLVGNPLSAQDYNGYSYCANNPMKYTDPSGYTYKQFMDDHYESYFYRGGIMNGGTFYRQSFSGGGAYTPGPAPGFNVGALAGSAGYTYVGDKYVDRATGNTVSWGDVKTNYVDRFGRDWTTEGKQYLTNLQYQINSRSFSTSQIPATAQNSSIGSLGNSTAHFYSTAFNVHFFSNEKDAYNYMWTNSFYDNGKTVEISAWVISIGIIVMPIYRNTSIRAENDYLPVHTIDGKKEVLYNGSWWVIMGHIHTHPTYSSSIGVSKGDYGMMDYINMPITILWNNRAWLISGRNGNNTNLGNW